MPRTLPRIEDYFPYVTHKLSVTKRNLGVRAYRAFSNWAFSEKRFEGLEDMVAWEHAHGRGKDGSPGTNIIFIGRHLSEFDWGELQLKFMQEGIKTIIQAGANLFIGPLDEFLRRTGGFKVFREETTLHDPRWLADIIKGFLEEDLGIDLKSRVDISKELAEDIYRAFFDKSLMEGYHVLMFSEYIRIEGKDKSTIKYGRSYDGRLLPFSPVPLLVPYYFQKTHPDHDIVLYPFSVSHERVIEDENFRHLEELKAKGASSRRIYLEDLLWNLTFRLRQKPSRVHIAYGKPIPIKDLPSRGVTGRSRLAPYLREEVGKLSVPFPTQLIALALDPVGSGNHVPIGQIKDRMRQARDSLAARGERFVQYLPEDMDAALEQAHGQFYQKKRREIARFDGSHVEIYRPDVLAQYANHCRHLLEE